MASTDVIDGRRLRREQNREAVLDALSELFAEGQYTPTSRQIADRAGLSLRSLVRYFDDFDDLVGSAIARQERQARPLMELTVTAGAPTAEKVRAVVDSRVRLWETIGAAARAGRVCAHRQPVVADGIARSRRHFRRQLSQLFAPELERTGGQVLAAADVLLSFESYELLRSAQRLSRAATVSTLVAALESLLDPVEVHR